jgi:hypothetical protein
LPCRSPGALVAATDVAVLSRATGPGVGSTIPGYWACSKGHKAGVIGPGVGDTPEGGIPVRPTSRAGSSGGAIKYERRTAVPAASAQWR